MYTVLPTQKSAAAAQINALPGLRIRRKPSPSLPDLSNLQGDVNGGLAFSPDGKHLFIAGGDNSVKLIEIGSGRLLYSLKDHEYLISAMALSPDGNLLATGTWSKTVNLWETRNGALRYTLNQHNGKISSLAFSPDGQGLACGSWDAGVRLWNTQDGKLLAHYVGHRGRVGAVAFSSDGSLLVSAGEEHHLKLWPVHRSGRILRRLRGHIMPITALHSVPGTSIMVSADSGGTLYLWRLDPQRCRRWYAFLLPCTPAETLRGHESKITCLAVSRDGALLASASEEKHIILWELDKGWVRHVMRGQAQTTIALAFSPDGRTLAAAGRDHTLRLWDTASGTLRASYRLVKGK